MLTPADILILSFVMLRVPDDVLIRIFDFYVIEYSDQREEQRIQEWIMLAHVCRRWRTIVFQSPRRLNLRLRCTDKTRARATLDIWPPLPIIIHDSFDILNRRNGTSSVDNIIAAIEHTDRVYQVNLKYLTSSRLKYVTDSAAMHKPFPELTHLHLVVFVDDGTGPILPDSFLGGTAPRLRSLYLDGVAYPGLPKLLLSATNLVSLSLHDIPGSGYIPPEVIATKLSALTNLEFLRLRFQCPRPRPALVLVESRRQPRPPLTRSILPSLTKFLFKGASEYLEEILAHIEPPRLIELHIVFFNQLIFDLPQLLGFVSRRPTGRAKEGHIAFNSKAVIAKFPSLTSDFGVLSVQVPCTASEWQLSSVEQVCTSSLPPLSMLEDLYIFEDRENPPRWQDDVENTLWLELLRPFAATMNLYLCEKFGQRIAPALQELVEGSTAEVFPTLKTIFLEGTQPSGRLHKGIEKFIAAKQLTSHPVAVSRWDRKRHWDIHD